MLTSTRWLGMASMAMSSASRRFEVLPAAPRSRARRNTPLYRLKTSSYHVAMVLSALAEGLDPSEVSRVFGFRQATITTRTARAGEHAHTLHERFFSNLHLPHLQLDHCCARGRVAPGRCCGSGSPSTRAPKSSPCSIWVRARNTWRTCSSTRCERDWSLAVSRSLPVMGSISTFMRLSAHFGQWLQVRWRGRKVLRWQVKKCYQRRKLIRVTHVMRLGTEGALRV